MADHDANAPGLQDQLEDRIRELSEALDQRSRELKETRIPGRDERGAARDFQFADRYPSCARRGG